MSSAVKNFTAAASLPFATFSPLDVFSVDPFSLLNVGKGFGTWAATTAAIVTALLILEHSGYRYKKAHLPGETWTIPIIGKFADSVSPTMEKYKKQWQYALSAVSVFNM